MGYGDVVLPSERRMLGRLEGIVGVLMCGVSVSILFGQSPGSSAAKCDPRISETDFRIHALIAPATRSISSRPR